MSRDAQCIAVDVACDAGDVLGEGPLWNVDGGVLYWLDIERRFIHALEPERRAHERVVIQLQPSALGLRARGGLIVAATRCLLGLDRLDGEPRVLAELTDVRSDVRFNDGECDPQGRFWAGTTSGSDAGGAALYRLEHDGSVTTVLRDVTISNGLAWAPDHSTLFYVDTPTGGVDAFDYDAETGTISRRRRLIDINPRDGYPDGMTVDAEGFLWVALWGGGTVRRYRPDGRLEAIVTVPSSQPTSCCFGGKRLDQLFITSARYGLSPEQLTREPLAGALFTCQPGVTGLPPTAVSEI